MSRLLRFALGFAVLALAGCQSSGYAVRPVPRIAADSVGKPVSRLKEELGEPRKIDSTPTRQIYVWFLAAVARGRAGRISRLRNRSERGRALGAGDRLFAVEHRLVQVRGSAAQDPRGGAPGACLRIPHEPRRFAAAADTAPHGSGRKRHRGELC